MLDLQKQEFELGTIHWWPYLRLISSGMPQGSILGPLGFIIYVNDIPNSVPDLSLMLYADDTSAFTSHKDIGTWWA